MYVPTRRHYARFASGKWQIADQMPDDWPAEVVRVISAEGLAAYGGEAARGWFIFCTRSPLAPDTGGCVFLYNDQTGYATRPGGPARTP